MSRSPGEGPDPLDDPIWSSLCGTLEHLSQRKGRAARFLPGVSILAGIEERTHEALADLAALIQPGEVAALIAPSAEPGPDWQFVRHVPLRQMVCERPVEGSDAGMVDLSLADADEMMALVELTQPGPFSPRTVEMGRYLGLREDGRLAAMAGERLAPPGGRELSAVCTHPDFRGRGYGERLCRAITNGIQARGETAYLAVAPESQSFTTSHGLYERLGFRDRAELLLSILVRTAS